MAHGCHPDLRCQKNIVFHQPRDYHFTGLQRRKQDHACVVAGTASTRERNYPHTLATVWGPDQKEPCILLTDEKPDDMLAKVYGVLSWIEMGFQGLKREGWSWQCPRRADHARAPCGLIMAGAGHRHTVRGCLWHAGKRRTLSAGQNFLAECHLSSYVLHVSPKFLLVGSLLANRETIFHLSFQIQREDPGPICPGKAQLSRSGSVVWPS